jgi:hypothetical protein
MAQGIVLLLFVALVISYAVVRARRRMGMMVTGKTWIVLIGVIALVVFASWAAQSH